MQTREALEKLVIYVKTGIQQFFNIFIILLLSLAFFSTACFAAVKQPDMEKGAYVHIMDESGSPISNAAVSIFDGFTFHNSKADIKGEYYISDIPVSKNNYMVIFISKEGFIPIADNVKVEDARVIEHPAIMKKTTSQHTGFIIGVIYHPVRGGKLQFTRGIKGFSIHKEVFIKGSETVITKETDKNGLFLFELPQGRYILSNGGGREKPEIDLLSGKTVIKNLRSGFTLID